jgi:all-trans-retinol 13,14-reductase
MGGMTAAAMLAKLGRRVLVLERHAIPGGFTQTFKRPGYRWDVGVHIVGEMTEHSYAGRMLKDLTNGQLQWEPVGPIYDEFNFPDGFTIQFPDTPDAFRATLAESFPDQRQEIDDYLTLVRNVARASGRYLQSRALPKLIGGQKKAAETVRPHIAATTQEVLESVVGDPQLRSVLAAQWGYYGAPPSQSSFAMHALMVQHFIYGAFYPAGTAASIAPALLQTVADVGGWSSVRRPVAEILVRRGRAVGVRLDDGSEIASKQVISAAGAPLTAALLGDQAPESWAQAYRTAGPAHVSLYLGFAGADITRLGAERFCQWYYDSWEVESADWKIDSARPLEPAPVMFCSFPSTKDPLHDPGEKQRHTGEAITFVPWESFSDWLGSRWKRRGDSYDGFKQRITDAMLEQYLDRYPQLEPYVDHVELSTPLSTHHFTGAHRGSIYGLGTEPERFTDGTLMPRTAIRGLYLAGSDAGTPGITGALIGGVLAAVAAEPIRGGRYAQRIMAAKPTVLA